MNRDKLEEILTYNIPLEGLAPNSGIYEFYNEGNMSLGVSYETSDWTGENVYIFNIYLGDQYINIDGEYDSIYDAIDVVCDEWNKVKENMV